MDVGSNKFNSVLIFTLDSAINYLNNEESNEITIVFEKDIANRNELARIGEILLGKEVLIGNLEVIKDFSSSAILYCRKNEIKV